MHFRSIPLRRSRFAWCSLCAALTGSACVGVADEQTSQTGYAATVDETVPLGCTTAVVRGLSEQIADEMLCLAPGMLVRFDEGDSLVFASEAVIPLVSPEARDALLAAVAGSSEALSINSAFRSVAQQYVIYKWFQAGRCNIAAAATPGNSNHESGRAIDVGNHEDWVDRLPMFGWVQTVLPSDPVHFEHLDSPDMRGLDVHAFQRLWNRNHADDLIDEDGDYGPATAARLGESPAEGFPIGACDTDGKAGMLTPLDTPLSVESESRTTVRLAISNTGAVAWQSGEYTLVPALPLGRRSAFVDELAWLSPDQVAVVPSALVTGESTILEVPVKAPAVDVSTVFEEAFALVDRNGVELVGAMVRLEIEVLPPDGQGGEGGEGCDDCSGSGTPSAGSLLLMCLVAGAARRRWAMVWRQGGRCV